MVRLKKGRLATRLKPPALSGRSLPVVFADIALIRADQKPNFPDEEGNYADPNVIIGAGRVPANYPRKVACGKNLVIYSSWADNVPSCKNHGGPGNGDNSITQRALANAEAVADTISCDGDCIKRVTLLWRGWRCNKEPNTFIAYGAVEVVLVCQVED